MYKIVILGNGTDWLETSLRKSCDELNVSFYNSKTPRGYSSIIDLLISIHYSSRLNSKIELPFKRVWYKYFCECIQKEKKDPLIIIIYDRNSLANDEGFLSYVKQYYERAILVYVFTNTCAISGAQKHGFIHKLKEYYQIIYAFEEADSEKYGFKRTHNIYRKTKEDNPTNDTSVLFVGRAKNRLSLLHSIYRRLHELGISADFYISDVSDKDKIQDSNINYNTYLSYNDVVEKVLKSSHVLDVVQMNTTGYTLKVIEAVHYNKKLITNNPDIYYAPFYDEKRILYIENADDITAEFFKDNIAIYSYEDRYYFSLEYFIEKMVKDIEELYKGEIKE